MHNCPIFSIEYHFVGTCIILTVAEQPELMVNLHTAFKRSLNAYTKGLCIVSVFKFASRTFLRLRDLMAREYFSKLTN